MSIDSAIKDLTDALNRNTAALEKAAGVTGGAAASTAAAKPATVKKGATAQTDGEKVTQDQVNAALIKIKDDFGMDEAKAIIKEHAKVDRMADIKPPAFKAVYDAAVAKHAELTAEAEGGGDSGDGL